MKIKIILILLTYFLSGCAQKTHTLDSSKTAAKIKTANNGSKENKTQTVDKSIIVTFKDIDTNIITIGKPLTGYISVHDVDKVNTHFENDDLNLDLEADNKTGIIKAIATPKAKKSNVNIREKTVTHKDINTIQSINSNFKTKIEYKTDSIAKNSISHTYPIITFKGFKTIIIWFLLIAGLLLIAIYLFKKFNIISLLWRWASKII